MVVVHQEPLAEDVLLQKPNANAVRSLQTVIQIQSEQLLLRLLLLASDLRTALKRVCVCVCARAGQYWQSVKPCSGSVSLSYLAAQRRDCEETDAVNALASLSVGVLTSKRYTTRTHARTQVHTQDRR